MIKIGRKTTTTAGPNSPSGNSMAKAMARKTHEIIAELKLARIVFSEQLWNTMEKRIPTRKSARKKYEGFNLIFLPV